MTKHSGLTIICNGCGEAMRDLGEWPVIYPKASSLEAKNIQQGSRYGCRTCRTPHPEFDKGIPVMATIVEIS